MRKDRYYLKFIIVDKFLLCFKKHLHSFVQSTVFAGLVACQTNCLYFEKKKLGDIGISSNLIGSLSLAN